MILESKELTKKFGSVTAVDNVALALEEGHIYAMLGPNGSGKSTLARLIMGIEQPDSGEIKIG